MSDQETARGMGRSISSWLWDFAILAGIIFVFAIALSARGMPSIRRYLRVRPM